MEPTITVKNGDVDQEIFMSFGLLNRLTRHLGNIDHLPILAVDPELQETMVREIFTQRDAKGNPVGTPPTLDEIRVSLDDIDRLLDFVGEHISDFFTRAAEKAQSRMLKINERMGVLSASMPTRPGS